MARRKPKVTIEKIAFGTCHGAQQKVFRAHVSATVGKVRKQMTFEGDAHEIQAIIARERDDWIAEQFRQDM